MGHRSICKENMIRGDESERISVLLNGSWIVFSFEQTVPFRFGLLDQLGREGLLLAVVRRHVIVIVRFGCLSKDSSCSLRERNEVLPLIPFIGSPAQYISLQPMIAHSGPKRIEVHIG